MAKQNARQDVRKRRALVKQHRKVGPKARRLASKVRRYLADKTDAEKKGTTPTRTPPQGYVNG